MRHNTSVRIPLICRLSWWSDSLDAVGLKKKKRFLIKNLIFLKFDKYINLGNCSWCFILMIRKFAWDKCRLGLATVYSHIFIFLYFFFSMLTIVSHDGRAQWSSSSSKFVLHMHNFSIGSYPVSPKLIIFFNQCFKSYT